MTTRQEYQKKIEAQIAEWRADIEKLQEKAKTASDERRKELDEAVVKLKANKEELKQKYSEIKEASDSAWGDLKIGLDIAVKSLGEAFQSARERFKHH